MQGVETMTATKPSKTRKPRKPARAKPAEQQAEPAPVDAFGRGPFCEHCNDAPGVYCSHCSI
jgi:hypothetical protein